MSLSRRQFLASSAAAAASGFAGLAKATGAPCTPCADVGFGPLVADPEGLIDLPIGFRYRVISRRGDRMDDGFLVPDRPDGMATFAGPKGTTIEPASGTT